MSVKFNSLFDNDIITNSEDYYPIFKEDDILELNDLLLTFDKQKLKANDTLFERNFGNIPNYLLSGRPCSTSLCTSNKFCDSSGWPELFNEQFDKCNNFFSPQTGKSEPNNYLKNIDVDSFLKNVDHTYNICKHERKNFKTCNKDDKLCELSKLQLECHKDIYDKDNYSVNVKNLNNDFNSNNKNCMKNNDITSMENKFFRPTKRRDVLNW